MSVGQKQSDLNNRVREYLRERAFRPGDQLPNEREFATLLGVGRTVLRPVLQALEADGILERRPQAGTFLLAVPSPSAHHAKITLIAPFGGATAPVRETDPLWLHRVISAFERVLLPSGARLLLVDQAPLLADPGSIKGLAAKAIQDGAQAVVLLHPLASREKTVCALGMLHDSGVHPIIVSARTYPGLASQVYFDSGWGAYLATRHLLTLGHERIGFAGAAGGHEWVRERVRGYGDALDVAGVARRDEWVWTAGDGERLPEAGDGVAAARHFLTLPTLARPTALVAANDVIALGVLEEARRQGLAVPGDLSVIGFDNDPDALLAGLSTIERPTEALGEAIARVTLERLVAGAEAATVTYRLRPVLIERSTVGALNKSEQASLLGSANVMEEKHAA